MQFAHGPFRSGLTLFSFSSIAFLALISAAITFVAVEVIFGTQPFSLIGLPWSDRPPGI